jgi:hypothetical protein
VIRMRRAQLSFGDGLIHEAIEDLREDWMIHTDRVLEDEHLVVTVCDALAVIHCFIPRKELGSIRLRCARLPSLPRSPLRASAGGLFIFSDPSTISRTTFDGWPCQRASPAFKRYSIGP